MGVYLGGFIGAVSHMTWIVEISTIFVNVRYILLYMKLDQGVLYKLNGVLIAVSFFVFRVCFFHWVIFELFMKHFFFNGNMFWNDQQLSKTQEKVAVFAVSLYVLFYYLQLYWFCRIVGGLLKVLGLAKFFGVKATDEDAPEQKKKGE